jgi:hypothetical protein
LKLKKILRKICYVNNNQVLTRKTDKP